MARYETDIFPDPAHGAPHAGGVEPKPRVDPNAATEAFRAPVRRAVFSAIADAAGATDEEFPSAPDLSPLPELPHDDPK